MQGQLLTLTQGFWTGIPAPTVTDQWMRCTSAVQATCTAISGATTTSYTLTASDVPGYVMVVESGTNTDPLTMVDTTTTQTSNFVGPVAPLPPPVNTRLPQISGPPAENQVLTTDNGAWTNNPTSFTYQWLRCTNGACTKQITNGGNAQTYTVKTVDVTHTLEVQVTAQNAGGSTVATSAQTAVIGPPVPPVPVPVNTAAPTISGTTRVGQTLTEGAASWSNSPTSTAIQWRRCDSTGATATCKDIAGATAKTYTLTTDDLGATMQVAESATNAGGTSIAYSGITGAVANTAGFVPPPSPNPGSTPTVSGPAQFGQMLSATGAQFSGNPGTFSYQWQRCTALGCTPIQGANGATYTPGSSDLGETIAVAETASNTGGTSGTVVSPRTDTITAPSTTGLQANSSTPVAGQTVTLIATVTSAAGSVKPAGTVDFHSNGTAIPGCTGLALGSAAPTAVCQTSFPAAVASVTAAYSAAAGTFITGSASSPTTLTVATAATTVTVAASAHVSLGTKTTYTATVHPPIGSRLTPTGRVTFTDGGKSIKGCGSAALAASRAPCSVKYLGLKQHRISVRYSGDANFAPSASLTSHVLVQPQAPSGVVTAAMYWSFGYSPHSTRVKSLTATGLSAGMHITLTCRGGGCPFSTQAVTVVAHGKCSKAAKKRGCVAAPSFNLTSMFHRAHLHVGTHLTVVVTHRAWIGKYYLFTIRAGRRPSTDVSCLAVNGTRPGVGCSAR